ncbi:MAG: SCO family protein [Candidatus Binatia bacterium]|nr:SCO family protein [Candidatus Binatia bacterium]
MTEASAPSTRRRGLAPILIGAALAGLLLLFLGLQAMPDRNPALPVIATVPDFTLVSSQGEPFGRRDLLGHPWIADLMFTSCAGVCPRMTTEMARIEEGAHDLPNARFISISVDPERDTPEVLAAYAKKLDVERDRWFFLTGDRDAVYELASSGLLLPAQEGDVDQGQEAVLHSSRFVLIDSEGRVRGFYDSRDTGALLRLRSDLRRVDDAPLG